MVLQAIFEKLKLDMADCHLVAVVNDLECSKYSSKIKKDISYLTKCESYFNFRLHPLELHCSCCSLASSFFDILVIIK